MEPEKPKSYEGMGPGRPRKNPLDRQKYNTKTIYFPSSTLYDIAWRAFDKLCHDNDKPFLYNRNKHFKRGVIIRRLILNYVMTNSKDEKVKNVVKDIILLENKERVSKWEKDNGKKYKPKPRA